MGQVHYLGEFTAYLDPIGNASATSERLVSGGIYTYTRNTYDRTQQLLSEIRADVPGYANTFAYDGTGNRLTQNALGIRTTYQYGSGNRLLSEQTGTALTTYSYDQAGNLPLINAANALTTYSWNTDNRSISSFISHSNVAE